jgi:hypothetical protein
VGLLTERSRPLCEDARPTKEFGITPLTPAGASKNQRDISDPLPLPVAVKIVRYPCRELVLVDDFYPCPFRYAGTLRHRHTIGCRESHSRGFARLP